MLQKIRKTHLIAGAAGAVLLGLLAWAFAPQPVAVETARVAEGRFEQGIEEDGQTRLKDRYSVSAPVAARLARITLREGDRVAAGDPVALLMPVMSAMIDERTRREADARLRMASALVARSDARVERARIAEEEAQLELHRTEKLTREGFLAGSRLDSARLARDAARREQEAALAEHDAARHERAQAAAALQPAQGAIEAGKPYTLRSPVDGVVLKVAQPSEATLPAGAPLLDVGDPSRMEIVADLLTTDAVQARPGRRAVLERWGGPAVAGRVRRVEPAAFTKVSALGIEEQRVKVIVDIAEAPAAWGAMGDGFRVTLRIVTQEVDPAVLVPVGALFPIGDGGTGLYRLEGGRARLQAVELGGRNANEAWVRAGVQPGDIVIVYPPPTVADGKRVRSRQP